MYSTRLDTISEFQIDQLRLRISTVYTCVAAVYHLVFFVLMTVEMSGHDLVCFNKTFEAAEALLHMESPGSLHNERNSGRYNVCAFSV